MPTITTVDATWTNGVAMDEGELRRADSAMFLGDGSNNGVRGGIVRHGDNSLAVSVNGSDQVTVQAGAVVIPAATGLGVYRAALSAATTATNITSRNATNPRVDLVVFAIESGVAVIKTVDGTPSASPSAPALPANAVEVVRLNVPPVGGGAITVNYAFRTYATALGGVLYVETAARLPGSGNQKGQPAVALDTGIEHKWDGSAWTAVTPAAVAVSGANANYSSSSSVYRDSKTVSFYVDITTNVDVAANQTAASVAVGYRPPNDVYAFAMDFGTAAVVPVLLDTAGALRILPARTAGQRIRAVLTYVIT